jgi:hypothetical protein
MATIFAGIALAGFFMPPFLVPFRPIIDASIVFVPILVFYFLSRGFEYAADGAGVESMRDRRRQSMPLSICIASLNRPGVAID